MWGELGGSGKSATLPSVPVDDVRIKLLEERRPLLVGGHCDPEPVTQPPRSDGCEARKTWWDPEGSGFGGQLPLHIPFGIEDTTTQFTHDVSVVSVLAESGTNRTGVSGCASAINAKVPSTHNIARKLMNGTPAV